MTYKQLKARFDELQNQRQILANRRENVASQYRSAAGISRDGIGARLQVMDRSMIQIETDLAATSQALVNKAEPSIPVPPPPNLRRGVSPGDVFGISLMVFLGTMVIMVPLAVRRAKARWMRSGAPMNTPIPAGNDRLDRIEHAVDTIAIEIERVSENQRFMTRLMTETQLAGSIAAVRSSTEMAKSVAESESK
jgi:hypothetical protein